MKKRKKLSTNLSRDKFVDNFLLELAQSEFPLASVKAAALVLPEGVAASLENRRGCWRVTLRGKRASKAAGAFLDEALSHLYRQEVVKFNQEISGALLGQALEKGFPAMPPDPLERLEPQVAEDRRKDVASLMEQAHEK